MMNREINSENRHKIAGVGMSKRRHEQGQGHGTGKRSKQQKHLYLVLDDWAKGFTIHKLDADDPHLHDPPILRLMAPAPRSAMSFAAVGGSNIFAVSNRHRGTLVYDTDTAALGTGPSLPAPLLDGVNIFVPAAGDELYALAYYFTAPPSFQVMSTAVTTTTTTKGPCLSSPALDWSWRSAPSPLPFRADEAIVSHAVHPDGRTIFVSAHRMRCDRTFSFDATRGEWRCHGEWALPFEGQGHFDAQLDAWVGLHKDGGVCSCQVVAHGSTSVARPEWKTVKDKLWCQRKVARGSTLTCMGGGRFCVVECVPREGMEYEHAFGDRDGFMLRITMFGLRYSHKGELQTINCNTNSFVMSKYFPSFAPVAFWM